MPSKGTLLAYPDHDETFMVETDASGHQLVGRIFQHFDHPTKNNADGSALQVERGMGFHTSKLNGAQKNCSTIEKELLSTCEFLKIIDLRSLEHR